MNIVDLVITIIVVTLLVTIALGAVTYITYKLRTSRKPVPEDREAAGGSRFFVRYAPDPPSSPEN